MSQQLITLDFETHYDQEYGLKKLTTEEYIRDPRFEVIGVGIKVNDGPTQWYTGHQAKVELLSLDWEKATCVAHHAHFDGLILSHHFGITPHRWIDTLSMARALHGTEVGGSLATLAERYGIGKKGHEVVDAKGKHLADFTPAELHQYGEYCKNDVELTFALLQKLMAAQGLLPARFPGSEMKLIDLTVRMFTEPSLEIDAPRLQNYLDGEVGRKAAFLESVNLTAETLRSKAKLAEVFRQLGVAPPTKVSAKTGNVDFAFAKTDKEFIALLDHEDEMVRAIAEARLGMTSNLAQTRSERLLSIGTRGKLPIYLKYYGAHTGRWCVTGDTRIWVLGQEGVEQIALHELRPLDLVWNGFEFCPHEGLVSRGMKEVMEYDGIEGTPDHRVFIEGQDAPVTLEEAAIRGFVLQTAGAPSGHFSYAEDAV